MNKRAKKLTNAADFDKTGGAWELDAKDNQLKKKIKNAITKNAVTSLTVGEEVVYATMTSFEKGKIVELGKKSCKIESNNTIKSMPYSAVFAKDNFLF